MFVSRTRSSGMPLPVAIVRQPAENFIRNYFHNFPETHSPCNTGRTPLFEREPNPIVQSFYIDDAEEGECPFLCTPSPEPADIHRMLRLQSVDN